MCRLFYRWRNWEGLWPAVLPWVILSLWAVLVGLSLYFNVKHTLDLERDMALAQAEAVVEYNKISRQWNAKHGGAYVPVSDETPPNPYLEIEYRDFTAPHGVQMTKINPAYMSRQMSELAAERGALTFRLTSLELKNPQNTPTALEAEVLQGFERGEPPYDAIISDEQGRRLFYMSKFLVEPECLGCHADQGYRVGEVRGGISVEVPLPQAPSIGGPIMTHVALFLGGGVLLGFAAGRTRETFNVLSTNATYDELTGVGNRRSLIHHLSAEFRAARRHEYPLSLLVIDIDEFKRFNDHFGHGAGDVCLKRVADAMQVSLRRPGDFFGRYGGEEFVAILPYVGLSDALRVGEMLRDAVESAQIESPPESPALVVTVSIGAAELQKDDSDFGALFDRADKGMYQAKRRGRNQVAFVDNADSIGL